MKDPQVAYKEKLERMSNLISNNNYSNCFIIAQNLTNLSYTLDLDDELFISEVLEAIFVQLSKVMVAYEIPRDITQKLQDELGTKMRNLIKAYTNNDPQELYKCLRDIRCVATYNQLYIQHEFLNKRSGVI